MEPPRSMLRIFLSSTSRDLEKHRDAVRHLVDLFDEHPVVMGDFGARDGDATDVSLERVRSCDIYVLLLAWRYGTIPADETLSVTHLEYRAARDAGKPRLIFLAHQDTEADDGPDALFPATVRDSDYAAQALAFRDEVGRDRVADFFTTPESAALEVAAALHRIIPTLKPQGPRPPFKLAPRAPEFVGRASELADLCQRLRAGQSVGLSALVAGLGGIGKSALAAEALATLAAEPDAFPGGVTWARCDGREGLPGLAWLYDQLLADWGAPLAPEQIAQAQAAGIEAEIELRERALQARLRGAAPALALLDNVEIGLPLARALDTLSALHITALVTARHTPAVPRLAVVRLDVLDPAAAAQLFAERYREKGGEWDEARDRSATAAIVERLGWLPLAIELQAARAALSQVSVAQLAADLERDRSQGLLGDPTDVTRNLRYSFAQSLRTLSPLQRTRFAALGLPGGPDWPRSVVERLLAGIRERDDSTGVGAAPDSDDEPTASEMASAQADLDLLVALSLANLLPESRLRLHPLLLDYAQELWQAELATTQAAGLDALLAGIRRLVAELRRDFAALAREEEMIVAALDLAQARHVVPQQVIIIVDALENYLTLGGHWITGMRLRDWQLAACRAVGDRRREGTILNNLGYLARSLGKPEEARGYYEQALIIRREVGDQGGEGATLYNLGLLAYNLGQLDVAHTYYEQALAVLREADFQAMEGTTLNDLGSLARSLGKPEEARGYYEQALAIHREVGYRAGEATTINNLGYLANSQGRKEEARGYYEQALAITQEMGDRAGEGTTLNNLGAVADDLGQPEEARGYYEQALAIRREVGDRAGEGATLNNLGLLANSLGQRDEARVYYEQALAIHREVGNRAMEGTTLNNLGGLAYSLGQREEARGCYEQALAIRREVGDRAGEGTTLNNLGYLARSLGQPEEARGYYEQALAIFREIGAIDSARVVADNLVYLDSQSAVAPSNDLPDATPPSLPVVKPSARKRRWPWRRRSAE